MPFSGPLFHSNWNQLFPVTAAQPQFPESFVCNLATGMSWLGMTPIPFHSTINTVYSFALEFRKICIFNHAWNSDLLLFTPVLYYDSVRHLLAPDCI